MQQLGSEPSERLIVTMPPEMHTWLKETAGEYCSMAGIARTAIQLLIDLGWTPDNEN